MNEDLRQRMISVRFSTEEEQLIREKAEVQGWTISQLIRHSVLNNWLGWAEVSPTIWGISQPGATRLKLRAFVR